MNKYVLGIDGMGCGHCEAKVEETIRKNISLKKIKASHIKNNVVVICEHNLSSDDFKKILDPTGYRVTSFKKMEATKTLLGWK